MNPIYPVLPQFATQAHIDDAQYQAMYRASIDDPQQFWAQQAREFLTWQQPWDSVYAGDFSRGEVTWFAGGKLNAAANCLDRHLDERGDQTAIIWQGDQPEDSTTVSYRALHQQVCAVRMCCARKASKRVIGFVFTCR